MKLTKQNLLWSLLFGGRGGGGITPSGTLSIVSNGTYDVGAFAEASVLVPASTVDVGTKSISENGTHDVVGFANVDVNVAAVGNEDKLIDRTISGVYINTNVTTIGANVFASCKALTAVSFPECKLISNAAFANCTSLNTVSFPVCETLGNNAFSGCSALTAVSFPSCTSTGFNTFTNCSRLTTVSFPVCKRIGAYMFGTCTALTEVSFPMCEKIDGDAFTDCGALTSVSFSVCTLVSNSAFVGCSSLATASFPACASIGNYAFWKCRMLLSLYLLGSSVCRLGNANAFSSTPISNYTNYTDGVNGSIFVRASLYATYISSTNWSAYSARIVSLTDAQIAALG